MTCQRLLAVENLETFRALEAYAWIDRRGLDVLAMYRGDMDMPNKDAAEVIRNRPEPIWGFFDFDPAGLVMANSVPPVRLECVILPSQAWLRKASNSSRGRQLFDSPFAAFGRSLDHAEHPEVIALWHVMKSLRSAMTQERMLSADAPQMQGGNRRGRHARPASQKPTAPLSLSWHNLPTTDLAKLPSHIWS